jgi:hypothetical protein
LIPWGQTNTSELKFYSKLGFREKYKNKFEYVSKPIEYWLLLVYIKKIYKYGASDSLDLLTKINFYLKNKRDVLYPYLYNKLNVGKVLDKVVDLNDFIYIKYLQMTNYIAVPFIAINKYVYEMRWDILQSTIRKIWYPFWLSYRVLRIPLWVSYKSIEIPLWITYKLSIELPFRVSSYVLLILWDKTKKTSRYYFEALRRGKIWAPKLFDISKNYIDWGKEKYIIEKPKSKISYSQTRIKSIPTLRDENIDVFDLKFKDIQTIRYVEKLLYDYNPDTSHLKDWRTNDMLIFSSNKYRNLLSKFDSKSKLYSLRIARRPKSLRKWAFKKIINF